MRDKVISAEREQVKPWSVKFGSYAKPPRFAAGQRVFHLAEWLLEPVGYIPLPKRRQTIISNWPERPR